MTDYETLEQAIAPRYRLERELGRGGMAVVYLAEDLRHRRRVAIKVLEPELAQAIGAERFLREIETAAQLTHPNILPLHDSGEAGEFLYYVMPYVEGVSLRGRLYRERQLPIDEALRIALEVADALAYAHGQGIVHRDIKPENILMQAGHALVADFGIARAVGDVSGDRLTQAGSAIGTPVYMSPEQASGERNVDGRSDIYALGCVLYELLAGEPPYTGATAQALLARKSVDPVPSLHVVRETVPPGVEDIVNKALAKAPADRFATATQFAAEIQRELATLITGPQRVPTLAHGARSRARWWVAAGVAGVVLVAAAFMRLQGGAHLEKLETSSADYQPLTAFVDAATSPALSPDGRMLTFIRGRSTFFGPGEVYVKLLPDGEPVQLTNDGLNKMDPRFTADGGRITYTTYRTQGLDTWIVPALGGQPPRQLLGNAEALTSFADSAGQPRALYSELTGRHVQMAIVTSTESRGDHRVIYMPPEAGMAHRSYVSPDRTQVLVIEMDYYSWLPCRLVPFDGSSVGTPVGPAPAQCTDAAWSPDGKWMYFTANTGDGYHIWRQRYPRGKPEQVTRGITEEEGIAVAPDGRSFVTSIGTRQSTVWVHDARGDRQITSQGYAMYPRLSRDGTKLFYMVRAHAVRSIISGALWVADLATGERRPLLPGLLMQQYDISADGKRAVFVAADDTAHAPVVVASLDGQSAPRRVFDSDGLQAFFTADGDVIFSARQGHTNAIYRVKENGSELRKISDESNIVSVSPDGEWIAVWVPPNAIKAHRVKGGPATVICEKCNDPQWFDSPIWGVPIGSWSPDGRMFYLQYGKSAYAIPLRPGQALPALPAAGVSSESEVVSLPGARRIGDLGALPGSDPSVYAFTKIAPQRNIYRVPVR